MNSRTNLQDGAEMLSPQTTTANLSSSPSSTSTTPHNTKKKRGLTNKTKPRKRKRTTRFKSSNAIEEQKKRTAELVHNATVPHRLAVRDTPEAETYEQLVHFGTKLDSLLLQKQLQLERTVKTSKKKINRVLRVTVSNTYDNQSPKYSTNNAAQESLRDPATWVLRIEGHLLDKALPGVSRKALNKMKKKKFSSYFNKVVIQFANNSEQEESSSSSSVTTASPPSSSLSSGDSRALASSSSEAAVQDDLHFVEWHHDAAGPVPETDGFEIKRRGEKELDVIILLSANLLPARYRLSPSLSTLLSVAEDTKTNIIFAFWTYVREKRLQDPEDPRYVLCDQPLQDALGMDRVAFSAIPRTIDEHLSPPDPIELRYRIRLDGNPTDNERSFDIDVPFDDPYIPLALGKVKGEVEKEKALDARIADLAREIADKKKDQDFMRAFAESPHEFLNWIISSQVRDYNLLCSQHHRDTEEERHSSYYYHPVVEEAVSRYLSKQETTA